MWQWGMGEHEAPQNNVGIEVHVLTGLPPDAVLQQQRRVSKREDIVEGEATPVE